MGKLCRKGMVSAQRINWGFEKVWKKKFSLFSYIEKKKSRTSGKKKCHVRQSCLLLLKRKIFSEKALFRYFQDFEWKTSQLSARKMGRVCRNCIVLSQRSHLKKTNFFLMKASCVVFLKSDIERKDLVFLRKTSAWLSKLKSISPQEFFEDKFMNNFMFFFRFQQKTFQLPV